MIIRPQPPHRFRMPNKYYVLRCIGYSFQVVFVLFLWFFLVQWCMKCLFMNEVHWKGHSMRCAFVCMRCIGICEVPCLKELHCTLVWGAFIGIQCCWKLGWGGLQCIVNVRGELVSMRCIGMYEVPWYTNLTHHLLLLEALCCSKNLLFLQLSWVILGLLDVQHEVLSLLDADIVNDFLFHTKCYINMHKATLLSYSWYLLSNEQLCCLMSNNVYKLWPNVCPCIHRQSLFYNNNNNNKGFYIALKLRKYWYQSALQ